MFIYEVYIYIKFDIYSSRKLRKHNNNIIIKLTCVSDFYSIKNHIYPFISSDLDQTAKRS